MNRNEATKLGFYSTFEPMPEIHETYMMRALKLAEKGRFSVAPNPRVGCVVVHNNEIIGEGFHQMYGEPHAEVNAIRSVANKELLKNSTLYVTLEPCSHFGKTPPCADLIVSHQIPEVYIASQDPFKAVDGSGIERLRNAGTKVHLGIINEEAIELNKRFFTFHQSKRPYVILKWAETSDSFIGRLMSDPNHKDSWITSALSKQKVHLWRAEEQAILVGTQTALQDNPSLDTREVDGSNPLRVVIDRDLSLPKNLNIFDSKIASSLIINAHQNNQEGNIEYAKIDFSVDIIPQLLELLHERSIQSLMVEGGSRTLQSFIDGDYWDEARRFVGKKKFGQGVNAPNFGKSPVSVQNSGTDQLYYYKR